MRFDFSKELAAFDNFLRDYFLNLERFKHPASSRLFESITFSLFSGGKRFRPLLAMFVARAFQKSESQVWPWAAAVECVHTYSLVHDDLPALDNDDLRRGLPTSHKKYDEATAVLTGDALLTEAFQILSRHYDSDPKLGLILVHKLSQAAGLSGMIEGQMLDLFFDAGEPNRFNLTRLHEQKTGALIAASVEGSALALQLSVDQTHKLKLFGQKVGLAFQLADDIQDHIEERPEPVSFVGLIGLNETRKLLAQLTGDAMNILEEHGTEADPLRRLVNFNAERA